MIRDSNFLFLIKFDPRFAGHTRNTYENFNRLKVRSPVRGDASNWAGQHENRSCTSGTQGQWWGEVRTEPLLGIVTQTIRHREEHDK